MFLFRLYLLSNILSDFLAAIATLLISPWPHAIIGSLVNTHFLLPPPPLFPFDFNFQWQDDSILILFRLIRISFSLRTAQARISRFTLFHYDFIKIHRRKSFIFIIGFYQKIYFIRYFAYLFTIFTIILLLYFSLSLHTSMLVIVFIDMLLQALALPVSDYILMPKANAGRLSFYLFWKFHSQMENKWRYHFFPNYIKCAYFR